MSDQSPPEASKLGMPSVDPSTMYGLAWSTRARASRRSTSGGRYRQGDGIALEPQLFPDSPNRPQWPSAALQPGQEYRCRLEWRFHPTDTVEP